MENSKHNMKLNFIEILSLPSAEDKVFTPVEDGWSNAILNFGNDGWSIYAIGYQDAANILVAHIEEQEHHQDALVYPILFLYRQYLELALKGLIRNGRRLQNNREPFPQTHDIGSLWQICSQLLHEISPNDSVEEVRQIGRLISEFCKVDPQSMAFRYPEDRKGISSLTGMPHINIRRVRDVIGRIATIIDGADAKISEHLSIKADMDSYYE
ncbi:MAG: hypothetical protein HYV24_05145 [Deltaproteobacteria bacterium]|nr:hypothetical protein [Deltaproteobacteria bacterium]